MLAMKSRMTGRRPSRQRLKLSYFSADAARETLDVGRVQQDLAGGRWLPCPGADFTLHTHEHVATASDHATGRTVGLVAASRQLTSREPFLLLERLGLDTAYPPAALARRLVAMLLLQIAGSDGMPSAIAFRAPDEWAVETFLSLTHHFTGAVRYPPADGLPVAIASAQLAKRIASVVASSIRYDVATSALRGARIASNPGGNLQEIYGTSTAVDLTANHAVTAYDELLLVIDLRSEEETVLIDDARQAYRKP